jgi:hypothetical protein
MTELILRSLLEININKLCVLDFFSAYSVVKSLFFVEI